MRTVTAPKQQNFSTYQTKLLIIRTTHIFAHCLTAAEINK